ncbi:aspartate kinase [Francisella sp. Scap27]|uniref:aspartate kinase n=1 Tax=Francisella sp. Scap27 TaxID=2589986 RepID=UPI0015BFCAF2|nr:aspartate kinase [Francisella sp. Scap27]QLE78449.1 aspartate kinase [Francisella sp. Scap27]
MKKQINVAKFGGSSVANISAINKCIHILNTHSDIKIVVVSAQSGITNLLEDLTTSNLKNYKTIIAKIHEIISPITQHIDQEAFIYFRTCLKELELICQNTYINPSIKTTDQILSFGERMSAYLFTQILRKNAISARYVDARKIIKTNSEFTEAKPLIENICLAAENHLCLESNEVIVLGGFIGSNENDETTTLGRGGSDYSAALIAEAIDSKLLYIWTDVAGIYQADPRLIPTSKVIKKLNFAEASELSSFGAKVLHPATLQPAIRKNIEVFIGSTFYPEKGGTWVSNIKKEKRSIIRAITERKEQILITIKNLNLSKIPDISAVFKKYHININLVNVTDTMVSFTINQNIEHLEKNLINDLNYLLDSCEISIERNLSLTAIIGNNLNKIPKLPNKIANIIDQSNIKLSNYAPDGNSLYLVTNNKNFLEKIYKTLF